MPMRLLARLIVVLILLFTSTLVSAQPGPPCGTPPCGGPGGNPGPPVPLSGIELIIAAGAAYGARKIYQRARRN